MTGNPGNHLYADVGLTECDVSHDCEYALGGRVGDCEARNGTREEEREGAF